MIDLEAPNAMLDLETMGNGPNAAITAIGAVIFDVHLQRLDDPFYQVIDLGSSVENGATMDASTVLWWMQQDEFARAEFKRKGKPIARALERFADWIDDNGGSKEIRIWGNGAAFDNVILSSAYRRQQLVTPWQFWNDRCYRTVKNMFPQVRMERSGTHHNALDDAISQARHLMAIYAAGSAK